MRDIKHLTEINIVELVKQIGTPFAYISDEEIAECLKDRMFLASHCIYNGSADKFSYQSNHTFDLIKITTIVNEIMNDTYNYNYPIVIWDDGDEDAPQYDADGNGEYHIRAFRYCNKNIWLSINRAG